jgi:AcrR family transcriptional regulator
VPRPWVRRRRRHLKGLREEAPEGRRSHRHGRRTQAERSAATRALLLEATIDCLVDLGYAHTTTSDVARRAGLSRGAQLHHFPTKRELVVHAVEQLFERRRVEFLAAIATLPPEADRLEAATELLWSMLSGPSFAAVLEILVAARTDRSLRERVLPLLEQFRSTVEATFVALFGETRERGEAFDVAAPFALALLEGLALGRVLDGASDPSERVVSALKNLARLLLPSRGATPRSSP